MTWAQQLQKLWNYNMYKQTHEEKQNSSQIWAWVVTEDIPQEYYKASAGNKTLYFVSSWYKTLVGKQSSPLVTFSYYQSEKSKAYHIREFLP